MGFTLKAGVMAGRLRLDEPVELPDGTVVELTTANVADDLDAAERARLQLRPAADQFATGEGASADEALRRISARLPA
jgi:hypothetical protein